MSNTSLYSFISSTSVLLELSKKIISAISSGDFKSARSDLDELRLVRSLYGDLFEENLESLKNHHAAQSSEIKKLISLISELTTALSVIEQWQTTVKRDISLAGATTQMETIHLYIDIKLPCIWNYGNDVVVSDDQSEELVAALESRGQKKIIRLGSTNNPVCDAAGDEDDIEKLVLSWDYSKNTQLAVLIDAPDEHQNTLIRCATDLIKSANMRVNTVAKFSERWVINHLRNLHIISESHSIGELKSIIQGKPVAIISPGPSLGKNIHLVEKLGRTHILVAPVQTAQALQQHNIIPDFFIVVDPTDYSNVIKDFPVEKTAGLIIMEASHPNFMKMNFIRRFIITSNMLGYTTAKLTKETLDTSAGSSVSTHAAIMSVELQASEIILLGQDLAVGERHYYYRSGFDDIEGPTTAPQKPSIKQYTEVLGWNGTMVKTPSDYYVYLKELEILASRTETKKQRLINCSEEGAFINGFEHSRLEDYLANCALPRKALNVPQNKTDTDKSDARNVLDACLREEEIRLRSISKLCRINRELGKKIAKGNHKKLGQFESNERIIDSLVSQSPWLSSYIVKIAARTTRKIPLAKTMPENITLTTDYLTAIETSVKKLLLLLSELEEV